MPVIESCCIDHQNNAPSFRIFNLHLLLLPLATAVLILAINDTLSILNVMKLRKNQVM